MQKKSTFVYFCQLICKYGAILAANWPWTQCCGAATVPCNSRQILLATFLTGWQTLRGHQTVLLLHMLPAGKHFMGSPLHNARRLHQLLEPWTRLCQSCQLTGSSDCCISSCDRFQCFTAQLSVLMRVWASLCNQTSDISTNLHTSHNYRWYDGNYWAKHTLTLMWAADTPTKESDQRRL